MLESGWSQFFRGRSNRIARRHWGCPDESELGVYADGQIVGGEKSRVEAHIADCDFCLDQIAFLVRQKRAEIRVTVPASLVSRARQLSSPPTKLPARLSWQWQAAAAAFACVALATVVWLRRPEREIPPPRPEPTAGPAVQSPSKTLPEIPAESVPVPTVRNGGKTVSIPEIVFPVPGSSVARQDLEFRWKPLRGTLYYHVRVLTAEGDLAWEQRTESSSARLPEDVKLETGQKYFVQVRAYLPEGKTAQSRAVAFTVANHRQWPE